MRSDRDGSGNTGSPEAFAPAAPVFAPQSMGPGTPPQTGLPVAGFSLARWVGPRGNKARVSGIRCHGPSDEKSCKNVGMGAAL
jgi:hypothetical protein